MRGRGFLFGCYLVPAKIPCLKKYKIADITDNNPAKSEYHHY
jgi:hypothetical protein